MTRLNIFEIKSIYKFLDSKSLGYFSNTRWSNFYNLFLASFIKCDVDQDCLLNSEELTNCLDSEDMKVVSTYMPEGFDMEYLVREIIFSLDNDKKGGLNLSSFLLLKRIVIGFRQFHVEGLLDKETFYSSIKTTFADRLIDDMDSEMVYRLSISLMFEGIKSFQLNFANYFEACRLVYSFFAFGLTIGEGYITKEQLLRNYETDRYPSKLNTYMYENYFDLYSDDLKLNLNTDLTKIDPNSLRFEDHATLEFWANIYSNYTDLSKNIPVLNITGFKNLVSSNKYIRKKYWIYIAYSNFEDYSKMNSTYITPTNITDYDFITNFNTNFLEFGIKTLSNTRGRNKKTNLRVQEKSKIKINSYNKKNEAGVSVFDTLHTRTSSLFNLQLRDDDEGNPNQDKSNVSDIVSLVDSALTYYFTILDLNMNNYLTFEEFFLFIKYLRLYDRLNKNNGDPRGVLKSNCVNFVNDYNIFPKLSINEKMRVQNLDSINCEYIDFLLFFDYMIGPKEFVSILSEKNKNFVDELHLMIAMKRLNLYADVNQRLSEFRIGTLMNNYDYESVLNL